MHPRMSAVVAPKYARVGHLPHYSVAFTPPGRIAVVPAMQWLRGKIDHSILGQVGVKEMSGTGLDWTTSSIAALHSRVNIICRPPNPFPFPVDPRFLCCDGLEGTISTELGDLKDLTKL